MKQTAVEFLLNELRIENLAKVELLNFVLKTCNKAKEMEHEQLKKAYYLGIDEEYHYTDREQMFKNAYELIIKN